ncbi:MAG: HAD family hydrolase [Xanthomonadaceae bacterium]|nr:HAD family hydrolase [Xanthomonadaceae bacterium]MDP2186270.1 HAD family hydrolase [Xanthomonadales bacterium]MDZ4117651.1 HAD family hydrolase [Xanthomonadaceae bacterium]MDZ4379317.1 HAD family hydrolase [Xanthomonadaceae bacterium]
MSATVPLVVLIDVDNTLLDNDRFASDLRAHLDAGFGSAECARYWRIYDALRAESGYADYLGALQRFRSAALDHHALLQVSSFVLDYPFAERLYPGALAALAHLHTLGTTVVLSDGDIVFQPRKIMRSGLWDAVAGRVLVTVHKERALELVEQAFPARHYVLIDDKPALLAAIKRRLGARLTSVFVQQGHYAAVAWPGAEPPADLVLDGIDDACALASDQLQSGGCNTHAAFPVTAQYQEPT